MPQVYDRLKYDVNFVSSDSKIVKRLQRRKYDQVNIESTICLVVSPSLALYRSFLKHFTPTNKAAGYNDGNCPNFLRGDNGPDPCPL